MSDIKQAYALQISAVPVRNFKVFPTSMPFHDLNLTKLRNAAIGIQPV